MRALPDGGPDERGGSVSVEGANDLDNAVLVYNDQPLFVELAVLPVVDVDLVWQALADHHETASTGVPTGFGLDLTPEQAFEAWSGTTLALDGYLRTVSPEAAERVLSSATDFAEYAGSLAGIDSVYLTAFASAGRDLAATGPSLDAAAALLDQLGMPSVPGGGAAHTFINDAAHDRAALVDHDSLKAVIDAAGRNPTQIIDIILREGVGLAGSASRSLIPGSGQYVRDAGNAVVSAGEAAAFGAVVGGLGAAALGALGVVGAPLAALGALVAGVASLVSWLGGSHSDAAKDAARGEKVPVSPPAPMTDRDGRTITIGADGTSSPGRPAPAAPTSTPPHPPGPKATEGHCPRGDGDDPPELVLPGWGMEHTLIPTLGPHGPAMDAFIGGTGSGVLLPPATQLSWEGDVAASALWGDLITGKQAAQGGRGARIVDRALFERIARARYRAELAEALILQTDPSATLYDALAMLRAGGPSRRVVLRER